VGSGEGGGFRHSEYNFVFRERSHRWVVEEAGPWREGVLGRDEVIKKGLVDGH